MAKIFKVSGYMIDTDNFYRLGKIESGINYALDGMIHQHVHIEEADI